MNSTKIFITGGHLTPAQAFIDKLQQKYPSTLVYFIGRTKISPIAKDISQEKRIIGGYNIRFINIVTDRMPRALSAAAIKQLFLICIGFIQSLWLVARYNPDIVLTFGSYIAPPVVLAAWILRKKIVIHEQTTTPGWANLFSAKFSDLICISFAESNKFFPENKVRLTGLPIRPELFISKKDRIRPDINKPFIYVMGGTSGSESVNEIIFENLHFLLEKYSLIHQVGNKWTERAEIIKKELPVNTHGKYHIRAYIDVKEHVSYLSECEFVICRSGANTIGELSASGKPAILIPLPWSSSNEQLNNARWLAKKNAAVIMEQNNYSPGKFKQQIVEFISSLTVRKKYASRLASVYPKDAADRLLQEVIAFSK